MLDEIQEYHEYISMTKKSSRIIESLLLKYRGGLVRALTIIARYELFHPRNELAYKTRSDLHSYVKSVLSDWCFSEHSNYFEGNTLQNYISDIIAADSSKADSILEFNQKLYKQREFLENGDIYAPLNWDPPFINAFNFSIIIADATKRGPLKRRYLVCKKDAFFDTYYCYESGNEITTGPISESIAAKDKLIKYICAYLIEKEYALIGTENFIINRTDLANWMNYKALVAKNSKNYIFYTNSLCNDPIVINDNGRTSIHKDYLLKYDFQIMEEEQFAAFQDKANSFEYFYYKDHGAGRDTLTEDFVSKWYLFVKKGIDTSFKRKDIEKNKYKTSKGIRDICIKLLGFTLIRMRLIEKSNQREQDLLYWKKYYEDHMTTGGDITTYYFSQSKNENLPFFSLKKNQPVLSFDIANSLKKNLFDKIHSDPFFICSDKEIQYLLLNYPDKISDYDCFYATNNTSDPLGIYDCGK